MRVREWVCVLCLDAVRFIKFAALRHQMQHTQGATRCLGHLLDYTVRSFVRLGVWNHSHIPRQRPFVAAAPLFVHGIHTWFPSAQGWYSNKSACAFVPREGTHL